MRHVLAARIAIFDTQVQAALADDEQAWVRATRTAIARQRKLLIAGAAFGTSTCTF